MQFFLRAKAWQLFVMMIAPYLVYKTTGFGHTPVTFCILWLYFFTVLFGWFYAVAFASNQAVDSNLRMNLWMLRLALAIPVLHILLFTFAFLIPGSRGQLTQPPEWLVPMHFIAIFSFMLSIWLVAKQFTIVSVKREVMFVEYYGAFMGFWFCVIGVWFLQPRINQHFDSQ